MHTICIGRAWGRAVTGLVLLLTGCATGPQPRPCSIERTEGAVVARTSAGRLLLVYNLRPPTGTGLPVESGGFFHPLTTPRGITVTDLAPVDHPHHRGVFLAWVEMHGVKDADFWGWGEHAPVENRRIVNVHLGLGSKSGSGGFRADNEWRAEDTVLLNEHVDATVVPGPDANVLDLVYTLTANRELTLTRWAFSGFCVRVRRDGELACYSPQGLSTLPNPNHLKPETDWPDAPWYAYTLKRADGSEIGVAVINHRTNPPTLWHNQRDARMLNPCIVAPDDVTLKKGVPLALRYRVVTF